MLKRLFDIVMSAFALIIFSPILAVVALIIKITSPGPVFYRGVRAGRHNKDFRIYKFRSMIVDAEKTGVSSTTKDDDRITPIGKFVRATKLDEFPQLINVFKGEMSFVGPRPEVKKFTDMYQGEELKIWELKPGITDYASIDNVDEGEVLKDSINPDKDYLEKIRPGKIALQLKYYREQSFWTDIKIIWLTFRKLVFRK